MSSFQLLRSLLGAGLLTLALAAVAPSAVSSAAFAAEPAPNLIDVGVGESVIQRDSRTISRVLISDPAVAELRLLEEGQYQVRGLSVGSTDLWVWYRDDVSRPVTYKVVVSTDLTDIGRRIRGAVLGPAPKIYPVKNRLVVEGPVDDLETLERVSAIARIYDEDFVNLMTVRGDHQVQLKVVFAEVSRTGLRELGLSVLFDNNAGIGGQLAGFAPGTDVITLLGSFSGAFDVSAILAVLEQNKLSRTLAEPSLVALSGQQAEFMAGGEVPIPVGQRDDRITIEFKEYGVKLVFVPTVLSGNVIDMRAYVEVSEIDPNTTIRLQSIEVPGLLVRKGDSHLRLESGMTFAMAGMLHERTTSTRAAIPILGDLPLVGALFRYVKHKREETELVIFVTPELVRPMAPGEVPTAPGRTEGYNPSDFQLFIMGQLTVPGSRTAEPTGEYGMKR
ncbi:MAG: pilus assembly protein N-terminal domain-containing protein [Pseudomonadota bacterium]|nr:pilus assembly protein N-terminal domain-containing protein [Pseudomonadota bacterium]